MISHVEMDYPIRVWPVAAIVLLLLLGCAVVVTLWLIRKAQAPQSPTDQARPPAADAQKPLASTDPSPIADSSKEEPSEDEYDLDAKILAMLSQKGDPMLQSEIATNLGMQEDFLASWLASMERREMIRRTWDRTRSTYVIHLVAGPS